VRGGPQPTTDDGTANKQRDEKPSAHGGHCRRIIGNTRSASECHGARLDPLWPSGRQEIGTSQSAHCLLTFCYVQSLYDMNAGKESDMNTDFTPRVTARGKTSFA
jgi:hypothetical protein